MITDTVELAMICPDEKSLYNTNTHTHTHTHTHHLCNTEAVLEVVEGDVVVSSVDFEQELLQNLRLNVEGRDEVQICVHDLQEHHDLCVLPLPAHTHTHTHTHTKHKQHMSIISF